MRPPPFRDAGEALRFDGRFHLDAADPLDVLRSVGAFFDGKRPAEVAARPSACTDGPP